MNKFVSMSKKNSARGFHSINREDTHRYTRLLFENSKPFLFRKRPIVRISHLLYTQQRPKDFIIKIIQCQLHQQEENKKIMIIFSSSY